MRVSVREWRIGSKSELNTFYTITRDCDGVFSCTCPDFTFRGHECEHIKKVEQLIAGENQKNKLIMEYEDKVRDILQLARYAESHADWNELAALEHSLALAQFYRYTDPQKAHQILDRAKRGD